MGLAVFRVFEAFSSRSGAKELTVKLSGIKAQGGTTGGRDERFAAEQAMVSECRALVPVKAAPQRERGEARRARPAEFLAQLIAAREQVPQARERRRAEPDVAVHAYQAALATPPQRAGRTLSRAS